MARARGAWLTTQTVQIHEAMSEELKDPMRPEGPSPEEPEDDLADTPEGQPEEETDEEGVGSGRRSGSTTQEIEQRIELTANLLGRGLPKGVVKRQLKEKFGLSFRQAERYITRARQELVKRTGRPKEEHFVDSSAFWTSVIESPTSSLRDKMHARSQLDYLYALARPKTVEVSGKDHRPIQFLRFTRATPPEGLGEHANPATVS
jgi:hypothetical protein